MLTYRSETCIGQTTTHLVDRRVLVIIADQPTRHGFYSDDMLAVQRPLLALPERADRIDHATAVFVTPDGYMTKQWVNAMAEYGMPVRWDESIRDYGTCS